MPHASPGHLGSPVSPAPLAKGLALVLLLGGGGDAIGRQALRPRAELPQRQVAPVQRVQDLWYTQNH
jgi:hypothetical protein